MSPVWPMPASVPAAAVRRLDRGAVEGPARVQKVAVRTVPAPSVTPQHINPVGLRLMALQLENDHLRSELAQLRTG